MTVLSLVLNHSALLLIFDNQGLNQSPGLTNAEMNKLWKRLVLFYSNLRLGRSEHLTVAKSALGATASQHFIYIGKTTPLPTHQHSGISNWFLICSPPSGGCAYGLQLVSDHQSVGL